MHFFVVEDYKARINFIFLPYLLAHNEVMQTAINHTVMTEFVRRYQRPPTDDEDDLCRLDELGFDAFDRYVPVACFREYVRGVKNLRILDYKQKECKERLVADYHLAKEADRENATKKQGDAEDHGGECGSSGKVDDSVD